MKISTGLISFLLFSLLGVHCLTAQTEYNVYPGDTNNDGRVNVRDLLPVGIAFGREVDGREDMGIDWNAKLALDFMELFLPNTGVNFVHINANGDQLIDEQDLDAIQLNYDSTIMADLPPPWKPEPFAKVSYCPTLKVKFDDPIAFVLDTFFAQIWLEFPDTLAVPEPEGILGLSFSFTYPIDNIDDKQSRIIPKQAADDLLYVTANAQEVNVVKVLPPGRGEVGVAGRGRNVFLKSSLICEVGIVVEDMILRSSSERPFWIDIEPESVLMVNQQEEMFEFCLAAPDTIILSDEVDAVKAIHKDAVIRLWPNPNSGQFQIELPEPAERIQVFSSDGRQQWEQSISPNRIFELQLPKLVDGIYFLLLESQQGIYRKRFSLIGNR